MEFVTKLAACQNKSIWLAESSAYSQTLSR